MLAARVTSYLTVAAFHHLWLCAEQDDKRAAEGHDQRNAHVQD